VACWRSCVTTAGGSATSSSSARHQAGVHRLQPDQPIALGVEVGLDGDHRLVDVADGAGDGRGQGPIAQQGGEAGLAPELAVDGHQDGGHRLQLGGQIGVARLGQLAGCRRQL
jgi:hypothetical protein